MKKILTFTATIAWASLISTGSLVAKPAYDLDTIMKKGFKGTKKTPPILKKVLEKKATAEEKKLLADFLDALAENEPDKGDDKSWQEKTSALKVAMKANDLVALKKASHCKSCHNEHKKK